MTKQLLVAAGLAWALGVRPEHPKAALLTNKARGPAPAGAPGPAPLSACPGNPVCSNHGSCALTGVCWCGIGWAGANCSVEAPLMLEVSSVGPMDLQDMRGLYKADGMYLMPADGITPEAMQATFSKDVQAKFMYYDPNSGGWALSKFDSTCEDDVCMFGYAPGHTSRPSEKGYVFKADGSTHVYYKQLVYDAALQDPTQVYGSKVGYWQGVSFTHDPQIIDWHHPDLSEFNGMYVLQPRYVHMTNGKYAIFPTDLEGINKRWVAAGLRGNPRKWEIIAQTIDTTMRPYFPPTKGWSPDQFQVTYACTNHLLDDTCLKMETTCMTGSVDTLFAMNCCRSTCNSCPISRYACKLPRSNPGPLALMSTNTSVRRHSAFLAGDEHV